MNKQTTREQLHQLTAKDYSSQPAGYDHDKVSHGFHKLSNFKHEKNGVPFDKLEGRKQFYKNDQ